MTAVPWPRGTRYTVIKTWYQDDFGLFGRFDERISVALAQHRRVARVLHLSPPLPPADLRGRAAWAHNPERLLARATGDGAVLDGVHAFTAPLHLEDPAAVTVSTDWITRQLVPGTVPVLLTTPPLPFITAVTDQLFSQLPDLLQVTQIEDDHRLVWPELAAEVDATYHRQMARSGFGLASSAALVARYGGRPGYGPVFLTPRITEPARFASAAPAADLLDVPRPIALYTGWIGSRVDLALVRELVAQVPATFVFAGPGGEALNAPLAGLPNWLAIGPRSYAHLPHLLASAQAAIIPHELSPTTEGMTPEKLVHYLAAGLPVVSTPVAGTRELGPPLIRLATTASEFVEELKDALNETLDQRDPAAVLARRAAIQPLNQAAVADWFVRSCDAALAGRTVPTPPALRRPKRRLALRQR
jgi:glycosyltransferase involved in cell wall biosynthesis